MAAMIPHLTEDSRQQTVKQIDWQVERLLTEPAPEVYEQVPFDPANAEQWYAERAAWFAARGSTFVSPEPPAPETP